MLQQILRGTADNSILFIDLCRLLERMGFDKRTKGSHNIFRMKGIEEKPNLQCSGKHAKPYQVRQIREIIVKYHLEEKEL